MGTLTARVERIGVALAAASFAVVVSACGGQTSTVEATEAPTIVTPPQPSLEQGIRELKELGFDNPRANPDPHAAQYFPWVAEAGTCTLEFTKYEAWSSHSMVIIDGEEVPLLVADQEIPTDVTLAVIEEIPAYAHCFTHGAHPGVILN